MGTPWAPFGLAWAALGHLLSTLWAALGTMGHPLGIAGPTFSSTGASVWHPLDTSWRPLLPSGKSVAKKMKKITECWSFFDLFSRRVYMQSVHACAVQTHIWALFLTQFSRPQKNEKIGMAADNRGGHLRHISDKGGTKASGTSRLLF